MLKWYSDYLHEWRETPFDKVPEIFQDKTATVEDLKRWRAENDKAYHQRMEALEMTEYE